MTIFDGLIGFATKTSRHDEDNLSSEFYLLHFISLHFEDYPIANPPIERRERIYSGFSIRIAYRCIAIDNWADCLDA